MPDILLRSGEASPADVRLYDPTASGIHSVSITGSGGVVAAGSALVERTRVSLGSGGATGGGAAPIERTRHSNATGGAVASGAAVVERTRHSSASGGAVGSGTAPVERTRVSRGSGGVVGGGSAIVKRIRRDIGSGGGIGGGADPVERTRVVVGQGGAEGGGEAAWERSVSVHGDGGARAAFPVLHLTVQTDDAGDLPAFTFPYPTIKRLGLAEGLPGTIDLHLEPGATDGFCAVTAVGIPDPGITDWDGTWKWRAAFDPGLFGLVIATLRIVRFDGITNPEDPQFWMSSGLPSGGIATEFEGPQVFGSAAAGRLIIVFSLQNVDVVPFDVSIQVGPGVDFGFFVNETAALAPFETTPTAAVERTRIAVGSGGVTAGGSADMVASHPAVAGGAVSGGAAGIERTRVVLGSGGVAAGGAATLSYTQRGTSSFPGARRVSKGRPQVALARKLTLPANDPEPGWIKLDPTRKRRVIGTGGHRPWSGTAAITVTERPAVEAVAAQVRSNLDPPWIPVVPAPVRVWVPDPPVVHNPPRVPRVATVEAAGGVRSGGTGNAAGVPNLRGRQQLVDEDDQLMLALLDG